MLIRTVKHPQLKFPGHEFRKVIQHRDVFPTDAYCLEGLVLGLSKVLMKAREYEEV